MKISMLVAGAVALLLPFSSVAQPGAAEPEFSADAFRAHVTFLADDLLEGRDTGSRGHEIAARYVAAQFAALGLSPGGTEGSWYQPIAFVRYTLSGAPTLTVGGSTFTHGRTMLVRGTPDTAPLALEAPLVFAGYGLDAPVAGFDDYRGLDARGKLVVVLDGTPSGIPSDIASHMNSEKRRMAAARGAAGLITVRTRGSMAFPWERLLRASARPGMTWLNAEGKPYTEGLRFAATVNEEAAAALFQGAPRPLASVLDEAARNGGRPRGFALRGTARIAREGSTTTPVQSRNVLAILPGTDPALAGEFVLLMAHLDHIGIREPRPGDAPDADRINNGAMDNATGIATLIEVARQLSRPGNRPRRPILIAAVTGEEKGLLGAQYLARNPSVNGRVISVVNLDMPILTYDFRDVTAFGAEHSTMGPIVTRAAARMGVTVSPDPLPEEGLFVRSDHYRFVLEGVPSVFLMTGFANGGRERFRSFLDNEYHSPDDDLTQPFNWDAGARFARLNYLIAREIADGAEAPRWYSDSPFRSDRPGVARTQ